MSIIQFSLNDYQLKLINQTISQYITNMTQNMNICFINNNDILSKKANIVSFLNKHNVDDLALMESHLKPKSLFNINKYNLIRLDKLKIRGSGLMLLSFSTLKLYNKPDHFLEMIVKICNLDLVLIYSPPNINLNINMLQHINTLLTYPFLVVGDFHSS